MLISSSSRVDKGRIKRHILQKGCILHGRVYTGADGTDCDAVQRRHDGDAVDRCDGPRRHTARISQWHKVYRRGKEGVSTQYARPKHEGRHRGVDPGYSELHYSSAAGG